MPSRAKVRARWNEKYGPRQPGTGVNPGLARAMTDSEFYKRDVLPRVKDALIGVPANMLGAAVDLGVLAHRVHKKALNPNEEFSFETKDVPFSSDWIGSKMGADVESAAFIASGFISPDFKDIADGLSIGLILGGKAARRMDKLDTMQSALEIKARHGLKADDVPYAKGRMANQEMYENTGWWLDVDGKLKFHLNDTGSKLTPKFNGILNGDFEPTTFDKATRTGTFEVKVGDILRHDEAYEVYPELADLPVTLHVMQQFDGSYRISSNSKGIAGLEKAGDNMRVHLFNVDHEIDDTREYLLHEMQHWVQEFENFARGGNSQHVVELTEYLVAEDVVRAAIKGEIPDIDRENIAQYLTELLDTTPDTMGQGFLDQVEGFVRMLADGDDELLAAFNNKRNVLMEQTAKMLDALAARGMPAEELRDVVYSGYLRNWNKKYYSMLAGEVEARTVQEMLFMEDYSTPPPYLLELSSRRAAAPAVESKDRIVSFE